MYAFDLDLYSYEKINSYLYITPSLISQKSLS